MKSVKKKSGGIKNNPRLKLRSNKDDESDNDDESNKEQLSDYEFVVNCLCSPDIALRPQEILEYIAITIKIYVGTHLTINMHKKTFLIDSKHNNNSKYLLKSIQTNDTDKNIEKSMQLSLPINVKELHDFTRIGLIIPIIYQIPVINNNNNNNNNDDERKYFYNTSSRDVIAIIQERKTRLSFNDFKKGVLYPYILNNVHYEWHLLNNLYITTIQKNYKWQRTLIQTERNDARRRHLEQTFLAYSYGKTRNVIKSIILCDANTDLKLCVFSTTAGLFYTEPRLYYNYYDKNNTNYNYKMNISIPLLYRKTWELDESDIFVDFWTQGINDIYIWNNNSNMLYNITFNIIGLDKLKHDIDLNTIIKNMDAAQNRFDDNDNDDNDDDDNDDNDDNDNKDEMDPDIMNAKLTTNSLLAITPMFKIDTKKTIYAQSVKPQKDHCEIKAVYYQCDNDEYIDAIYWVEISKYGNWRYGGIAKEHLFKTSKQKSIHSKLRTKEKNFYQTAPIGITKETFYCSFVDDRDIKNKKFIIILKKHVVVIPLLKKNEINNEHNTRSFAVCLNVKDVVPKSLLMDNEIKLQSINQWHYNYSNATLYIFEKMAMAGAYPYRMNEIAINTFKLDQ